MVCWCCSAVVLQCCGELYHGGENLPNHLTATVNCTMPGKIYHCGVVVNCTMAGKIYQITVVLWCLSELYHGGENIPNNHSAEVNCTMVGKIHQIILVLWCQGTAVNCTMVGKIYQITAMPLYCSVTVLWWCSAAVNCTMVEKIYQITVVNCIMVGKIYHFTIVLWWIVPCQGKYTKLPQYHGEWYHRRKKYTKWLWCNGALYHGDENMLNHRGARVNCTVVEKNIPNHRG